MPLKEIVLREGNYKITTSVNLCDICDEHNSEHTCVICNSWICERHSVHIDIEIDDDWLPYICTECYNAGNYVELLNCISKDVTKLYQLKDDLLKDWKERTKKEK